MVPRLRTWGSQTRTEYGRVDAECREFSPMTRQPIGEYNRAAFLRSKERRSRPGRRRFSYFLGKCH